MADIAEIHAMMEQMKELARQEEESRRAGLELRAKADRCVDEIRRIERDNGMKPMKIVRNR